MIVLDTNLVSEAMKPEPDPAVRVWLNAQSAETLCLPGISLGLQAATWPRSRQPVWKRLTRGISNGLESPR